MAAEEPQHKGTGIIPLVAGLKVHPDIREKLPAELHRYLDEPLLASAWYPERDYLALLEVLAGKMDPAYVGGNVWSFLGKGAAQRDLAGDQDSTPPPSRTSSSGLYRQFVKAEPAGPGAFFLRTKKLWQLYRDTGALEVYRRGSEVVVLRLSGYHFAFRGLVDFQTAYFLEFARLSGLKMDGRAVPGGRGDTMDWEFTLESGSGVAEWIATLPEV